MTNLRLVGVVGGPAARVAQVCVDSERPQISALSLAVCALTLGLVPVTALELAKRSAPGSVGDRDRDCAVFVALPHGPVTGTLTV